MSMNTQFHLLIEKDEDGWYVGSIPELPGCHTQAQTLEELRERIREAALAYLGESDVSPSMEFVGVEDFAVSE